MQTIKTSELSGTTLNWAVAKCEGVEVAKFKESPSLFYGKGFDKYHPSTDWALGGPIIARENIELKPTYAGWTAFLGNTLFANASTPLIAAMRCYVASKLGDIVEVPDELAV